MNLQPIKILNLYACLGGNRYKWDEVANIEVTAIELNIDIASEYKKRFPKDEVKVTDAHKYLLNNYKNFDFIWSSPPCPSHSKIRISQKNRDNFVPLYPDLKLYEEIIFLDNYFDGLYCVENVTPYYEPLIQGKKRGRHIYWTNFNLPSSLNERKLIGLCVGIDEHNTLQVFHDIEINQNLGGYHNILRNLVDYEAGKTILQTALNIQTHSNLNQIKLL